MAQIHRLEADLTRQELHEGGYDFTLFEDDPIAQSPADHLAYLQRIEALNRGLREGG